MNEEDCEQYEKLEKEYYDLITSDYDKWKVNDIQERIEELKWEVIDILFDKIKSLVKEIKKISVVRVKDTYIDFDSIPDRDFFENNKKLREFLYNGAVYFGNNNTSDFEVQVGHYIVYNENKNSGNIYYLRDSNHLIYDFDEKIKFKDEGSDYFKCLNNFTKEKE